MVSKFAEQVTGKFADAWTASLLGPALLFWAGGGAALITCYGWRSFKPRLERLSGSEQVVLGAAAIAVLLLSTAMVRLLERSVLRGIEGYWPAFLERMREALAARQVKRLRSLDAEFQKIAGKRDRTPLEERRRVRLELELRMFPAGQQRVMPTRVGNILRAAEDWPREKYGVDTRICWPRLWLLLPGEARSDLSEARGAVDMGVRSCVWSAAFLVWAFWTWWPAAVALLGLILSYRSLARAAMVYGELLESAFDVYRDKLYSSLRLPLPRNAAEEQRCGKGLTEYLNRGSDAAKLVFSNAAAERDPVTPPGK